MWIDTHCHLNDAKAFPDPVAAIVAARAEGVDEIIVVGVEPESWSSARELAAHGVHYAAGWHPNYTADYNGSLYSLRNALQGAVALGEIGLDYHWDHSPRDTQRAALTDQLDLAAELDLPVVFHCREAYPDLLDVLESRPRQPFLLHCFVGDSDDARRAIALDCYFGIDGPITYKSAEALRDVVATLPPDRLVLETDSPYLSPVPYRGKPNSPAYIPYIGRKLAELLALSENECAALTSANARRFFRI
jgi:TatD DNase family protein